MATGELADAVIGMGLDIAALRADIVRSEHLTQAMLNKLETQAADTGRTVSRGLGNAFNFNQFVTAAQNIWAGIEPLARRARDEAVESAQVQAELNAVASESVDVINRYADAEAARLALDDELIKGMAARIAAYTEQIHLEGEDLRLATQLAIQYGALTGSYEQAGKMVGKYLTGDGSGGLRGVNVAVAEGATVHERLTAAIDATSGGMARAEAQANTTAGAWRGLQEVISNYLGEQAALLADNEDVTEALQRLSQVVIELDRAGALADMTELVATAADAMATLAEYSADAYKGLQILGAFAEGYNSGSNPFDAILSGIAAAEAKATVQHYKDDLAALGVVLEETTEKTEAATGATGALTDEYESGAKAAEAFAEAEAKRLADWNAEVDAMYDERQRIAEEYYDNIEKRAEEMLERMAKAEEEAAARRAKYLADYVNASASAQKWLRQGDEQLQQIDSVAGRIFKSILAITDETRNLTKLNITNLGALEGAEASTEGMADEMARSADEAERMRDAVKAAVSASATITRMPGDRGQSELLAQQLFQEGVRTGGFSEEEARAQLQVLQLETWFQEHGTRDPQARAKLAELNEARWQAEKLEQLIRLFELQQRASGADARPKGTETDPIVVKLSGPGSDTIFMSEGI